ncbi:MAG: hypothetical protein KF796_14090 [Ramlibacter sp.]|nr:hypothetical protein [Ramlibacter sp.]
MKEQGRGRPLKNQVEVIRLRLWYATLKQRLPGTSDYALDHLFGPEQAPETRRETFSRIRREGKQPPDQVFERVHRRLPEMQAFYTSPFWAAVMMESVSLWCVRESLEEFLIAQNLQRWNCSQLRLMLAKNIKPELIDEPMLYAYGFKQCKAKLLPLDLLLLYTLLAREAALLVREPQANSFQDLLHAELGDYIGSLISDEALEVPELLYEACCFPSHKPHPADSRVRAQAFYELPAIILPTGLHTTPR